MKAVRKFSKSTLSTMSSLYGIPFGSRTIPSDSNSSAPGGTNDRIWKESTDGLELTRIWNVFVEYRRGLSIWNTEMTTADWFGFHIRFTAIGWHFTELTEKILRLFWYISRIQPRYIWKLSSSGISADATKSFDFSAFNSNPATLNGQLFFPRRVYIQF